MNTRHKGQAWEKRAKRYLCSQGLSSLATNFSCRFGELDLIMRDDPWIVFVEVRYRNTEKYGGGLESIDNRKQQRIIQSAQCFLAKHPMHATSPCRFDAVTIGIVGGTQKISWIKDAFNCGTG